MEDGKRRRRTGTAIYSLMNFWMAMYDFANMTAQTFIIECFLEPLQESRVE